MKFFSTLFAAFGIGNVLVMITTTIFTVVTTGVVTIVVVVVTVATNANAKKAPELFSTALKLHRAYTASPPHDTDLYDIMGVSPNATLAEITKSYRILSRKYHPDKQRRNSEPQNQNHKHSEQKLQQIQKAYETLSDDSKRLPYHRYGWSIPILLLFLLLGPRVAPTDYYKLLQKQNSYTGSSSKSPDDKNIPLYNKLDRELMHLMGYDDSTMDVLATAMEAANNDNSGDNDDTHDGTTNPSKVLEEHRVCTVAALLLESIRPVVEGRLDARLYAHVLAQDCDRWKRLPLGAQIIRSVGRAYRHEGSEFLQRYKHNAKSNGDWHSTTSRGTRKQDTNTNKLNNGKHMVLQLKTDLKIGFRRKWRSTKDFLEAATVSGRLAVAERSFNEQENKLKIQQQEKQQRRKESNERIKYHGSSTSSTSSFLPRMDDYIGDDSGNVIVDVDVDDYESLEELEEEQKELEKLQAQQTLLQTLQIEALWKVCKIDLDRVVRRACAMILSGEYFFYSSHTSSYGIPIDNESNGWVTSSGETMDSEGARVAAAEVMKMTGEIMVQQSKEGTSWKH